ncbi:MAG TPA: TolC family protein [Bacteroidales bacterium]|nr:TolC family protein [Bacteroidales bacterium]
MSRYLRILPILLLAILLPASRGMGQTRPRLITLEDALEIARKQSPDALNSKQQFRESFWEYKSFRGTYLPQIGVTATIPNLNRAITKYTNPNGTEGYVTQEYVSYTGNLSVSQRIGWTGGTVFLNSGLQRIDNLGDSLYTSYLSTPVNIGYSQPIFTFNPYRWDRKIEPMKYNEAKRKYLEDVEQISITTTNYFFDLLEAQVEKEIAQTNLANYDTLYRIAKGRYELGKIAENDLLGLELDFLEAQAAVENANLGLDNALFRFRSYLRLKDTTAIQLVPPVNINFFPIDATSAIDHAEKNSSTAIDFQRRLLEAQRDVRQAKMENRFDAQLTAVFGLTQTAATLPESYNNPMDQQQVSLGLSIPIVDWGVSRGKIKMAESQQEIVKNAVEQEIIDFKRNVYLKVVQFNMQKNQLMIASKSDTVARKTYDVTKSRYLIGKINSILDLNNAQIKADDARKNFYAALQTYWRSYFEIRKMTLFDFSNNLPLSFQFEDVRP